MADKEKEDGKGKENGFDYDFEARDYQVQLSEQAIESNRIIFLPTGSGKTFISVMCITHFLNKNDCGSKKIGQGGKRAYFLVNTVALVKQQVNQIELNVPYSVSGYAGWMGVDFWDKEKWQTEMEAHEILVMTAQIFLNILLTRVITLQDVAIVVFDECHHGVSDHPMRQIMQQFKFTAVEDHPRVLGLTATLINKNVPEHKVEEEVRTLETTFLSKIATANNEQLVKAFSTNPQEMKVTYTPNDTNRKEYITSYRLFEKWQLFLKTVKIDEDNVADKSLHPPGAFQVDKKSNKTNKELKNVIEDIKINMDELGMYGGDIAALARLIQIEQIIHNCQVQSSRQVFQAIHSQLLLLRKYFESQYLQERTSKLEIIRKHTSDKVTKLLRILRTVINENSNDSCIVFVKRRFTAKILHKMVSEIAELDPTLKQIKCDFIVGYNVANPWKETKENILQKAYNDRVLQKFNSGLLNVIFGSSVVEEGMDVSHCNTVVMFDTPMDFRAYIQSKGRARHSTSRYVILTCDPRYDEKYLNFKKIEDTLKKLLCKGQYLLREAPSSDEVDTSLYANEKGLETYLPFGPNGPSITALIAISHVNRYMASLKTDKFTKITPYWFMKTEGDKFKCYLHIPFESKASGMVEGTWQSSKENAKRSVSLEACKKLHKVGELDDEHLLPISEKSLADTSSANLLPHWDKNEDFKIGTKRRKRAFPKIWAECLTGCAPAANVPVYLHLVQFKRMNVLSVDSERLKTYYQHFESPVTYAIVSSKKLPRLAPFPLYMSTGELEINILEGKIHSFSQSELDKISKFHGIIFDKVCGAVSYFLMRDFRNKENSYLIAPVLVAGGDVNIDWTVVEQANKRFPDLETVPSEEMRRSLAIKGENYLGMIVTPWYRAGQSTNYLVTNVRDDMSENSKFPSDTYDNFKDYFRDKYKIIPVIHQPLLEVKGLSSRMNNLKPLTLTKDLKANKKKEFAELEEFLLPEFCHLYPVPGKWWMKALLLPSVLHRVGQLCAAEELRQRLVRETNTGVETFPPGIRLKKLEADVSLNIHSVQIEATQLLTPLRISMNRPMPTPTQETDSPYQEPPNIFHDMETVTMLDVVVNETNAKENPTLNMEFNEPKTKIRTNFVKPPSLNMLQKSVAGPGPEQVQILQAITAAVANDLINCERLETLGDSFLKFAVSLTLFEKYKHIGEGFLTNLKGQAVGNKNLYFCGKDKNLGNILEVIPFSPPSDWVPPQFSICQKSKSVIIDCLVDPSVLCQMMIPEEDRARGKLSNKVEAAFAEILLSSENIDETHVHSSVFLNQLALQDKNISDAVEALLGVYLENSGLLGALRVMNWFEVIDPKVATEEVFTTVMSSPTLGARGSPNDLLVRPNLLEKILDYKFKDRAYMLQAVSHPSFHINCITNSYQRLEFLGDAVLDLLITIYIYENCKELHPGDLTDLRSALVNNITLGCISVRFGLHRFLLQRSKVLYDIISRFVKHQEARNYEVDNDILFLIEEGDTNMSEAIEVPKALGDVFEALIGAIYLDSGKDLNVTWRVIYNLMRQEIDTYKENVPKNHVRVLYESNCQPEFSKISISDDHVTMVKLEVLHQGQKLYFHGFGESKYQAKRAAAKHALRKMRSSVPQ